MAGLPPFFIFGGPGMPLGFPTIGGKPVLITREQFEACCCGACDCPEECPVTLEALFVAWRTLDWESVAETWVDDGPDGWERHPMCVRFVWVCVCGGEVEAWGVRGGTALPLHLEIVTPLLGADGQYFFAIEFHGWRGQAGPPQPVGDSLIVAGITQVIEAYGATVAPLDTLVVNGTYSISALIGGTPFGSWSSEGGLYYGQFEFFIDWDYFSENWVIGITPTSGDGSGLMASSGGFFIGVCFAFQAMPLIIYPTKTVPNIIGPGTVRLPGAVARQSQPSSTSYEVFRWLTPPG